MNVAVVAEFYPSRGDPVLGVWAHRQAIAVRDAGAQPYVLVLHRIVPPRAALHAGPEQAARALMRLAREPRRQLRDGLEVRYVPYISPPRDRSYDAWGAWAAPALALALRALARRVRLDLIHAHNAIPAGDAVRRARMALPLVVSVHGGDVFHTAHRLARGHAAVARALGAARLTLANSEGIAQLARAHGALQTRVVHLGAAQPAHAALAGRAYRPGRADHPARAAHLRGASPNREHPSLVTVGHLVARKRHADVVRALAVLSERHPTLRYVIIGEGPERDSLVRLARRLGVSERVELRGQLEPEAALEQARACTLFVMPSTEEAFGVAYIEAMAAGLPAIGCRGEPGPDEIAAAGGGFLLVPPGDIERLSQLIDELLRDPQTLREAGRRARQTVAESFSWERCGAQTLAAYREALR